MTIIIPSLYLLGALVVIATVLPLWRTERWWVRVWDFPRFQVAMLGVAVLAVFPAMNHPITAQDIAVLSVVASACLWQLSWIWRYLPLAPLEVERGSAAPDAPTRISLLTTNVLQDSRDAGALMTIIAKTSPDVILAVETDEWWCSTLTDGLSPDYSHNVTYPLSNGYGMALFSRLELVHPVVRFLVDEAIPSIKTGVRLRSGEVIDLYGLHPQPPAPQQDSTERDTELVLVGLEIKRIERPAIVLGDLNDVAWSSTTSKFKRVGGLLDPRRGRGFFNTYPAGLPGLRYPLDYIFHTPHFGLCEMRVLPRFQSDHLPLTAVLCLTNSTRM